MATPSSTLAWEIPWMEQPGGLQSMGSRREDRASSQRGLLPNVRGLLEFPQLGFEVTLDLSLFPPFLFLPLEWQYLSYASPTIEF